MIVGADRHLLETEPSRPNLYFFKLLIQEWVSCTRLETQGIKLGTVSLQVGVDFGAVSEIIGNRAVNLLKRQGVIVIGDTLRRKTCAYRKCRPALNTFTYRSDSEYSAAARRFFFRLRTTLLCLSSPPSINYFAICLDRGSCW